MAENCRAPGPDGTTSKKCGRFLGVFHRRPAYFSGVTRFPRSLPCPQAIDHLRFIDPADLEAVAARQRNNEVIIPSTHQRIARPLRRRPVGQHPRVDRPVPVAISALGCRYEAQVLAATGVPAARRLELNELPRTHVPRKTHRGLVTYRVVVNRAGLVEHRNSRRLGSRREKPLDAPGCQIDLDSPHGYGRNLPLIRTESFLHPIYQKIEFARIRIDRGLERAEQ